MSGSLNSLKLVNGPFFWATRNDIEMTGKKNGVLSMSPGLPLKRMKQCPETTVQFGYHLNLRDIVSSHTKWPEVIPLIWRGLLAYWMIQHPLRSDWLINLLFSLFKLMLNKVIDRFFHVALCSMLLKSIPLHLNRLRTVTNHKCLKTFMQIRTERIKRFCLLLSTKGAL